MLNLYPFPGNSTTQISIDHIPIPVTYFPQHLNLKCPSAPEWINLEQTQQTKQENVIIPPGIAAKKINNINVLSGSKLMTTKSGSSGS